jgi:ParB family transcriptional regulator, chromosome partitioning protein
MKMKASDRLQAKLGANMQASLGAGRQGQGQGRPPSTVSLPAGEAARYRGCVRVKDALTIDLERIVPDLDQPRKEFDPETIDRLARSLITRGQLMPIRVRWDAEAENYRIVAGERRYRAAVRAGLTSLQCIVASGPLTAGEVLQDQLVENCLREDLKPVEQANALRSLMDANGWSAQQVAEELQLSKPSVVKALALLKLPEAVRDRVDAGTLAPSVAYEISQLPRAEDQSDLAEQTAARGLTRSEVAAAVKAKAAGKSAPVKREVRLDDGTRITITGPAAAEGIEATVSALRQAAKRLAAEAGRDRAA